MPGGLAVRIFAALVLALVGANGAAAQAAPEYEVFGTFLVDPANPSVVYLNGAIGSTAGLDFRRAVRAYPAVDTIVLNSPGGGVVAGLTVADDVFRGGFTTIIPAGARCYSACSLIFLAGASRLAIGELGVHQVTADRIDAVEAQRAIADILDVLVLFDTPQQVITIMLRTPPEDMYVFTSEEVARFSLNKGDTAGAGALTLDDALIAAAFETRGPELVGQGVLVVDPEDRDGWIDVAVAWLSEGTGPAGLVRGYVDLGDQGTVSVAFGAWLQPGDETFALYLDADGPLRDYALAGVVTLTHDGGRVTTSAGSVDTGEEWQAALGERRWRERDVDALRDAEVISIILAGPEGDVLLSLVVDDAIADLFAPMLSALDGLSSPLGDGTEAEIPATAGYGIDGRVTDAPAGWYLAGEQIAVRIAGSASRPWVDLAFSPQTVVVTFGSADGFAVGAEAVTGIAGFPGLDFIAVEQGLVAARVGNSLIPVLSVAGPLELRLRGAGGEDIVVTIPRPPAFAALLGVVATRWGEPPPRVAAEPAGPDAGGAPQPTFGTFTLRANFSPNPYDVAVRAGGTVDAATLAPGCVGVIPSAPTARLDFTRGPRPISFAAASSEPTVLVVRDPAGAWHCASSISRNAVLTLDPRDGQYDIWVGTRRPGPTIEALLFFSETPGIGTPGTSPAGAATAGYREVAYHQDWFVFEYQTLCGVATHPVAAQPEFLATGDVAMMLVYMPGTMNVVPIIPSVEFQFPLDITRGVEVRIDGGRPFDFSPGGEGFRATLEGLRQAEELIAEARAGDTLELRVVDDDGNQRLYAISLRGVTAAMANASSACR